MHNRVRVITASLGTLLLLLIAYDSLIAQKKSPLKLDANADFKDELPRIPPKEPDEALKTFELLPGFRIEQVATEPAVVDPIAMSFDERGRMYVVCMRGYSEQAHELRGEIRLLEDTTGDGKVDKSTIFVDKLSWPTAVICYGGGIYVGMAPDIWYFKDTNGDGKSDLRRKVFTGFGRSNVQGLLNSFRWGLDNRIHGATSSSGGTVRYVVGVDAKTEPVNLRGRDFAFDPRTHRLEATSGGAQHGMSFDDWGRKFVCSNSRHLEMVLMEDRYLRRNRFLAAPNPRQLIAVDGGQAPVFRISPVEPWRIVRTRLRVAKKVPGPVEGGGRAAGYFTGSTGVTIYRGNAWPKEFRDNTSNGGWAFTGDVGSNIVHRKRVIFQGDYGWTAKRVDEKREFVASNDIWFRPVQMANAPDGTLHVLDMYREVIEHPKSLPPVIKKHLDLTSGRDRGRIYRIVADGFKQPDPLRLDEASTAALVATLEHPNGWHRDTAQRLLYERNDRKAVPLLLKLATESESSQGRIHALHALAGIEGPRGKSLKTAIVAALEATSRANVPLPLAARHPRVVEHAMRLAEPLARDDASLRELLYEHAKVGDKPSDGATYFQLACTLGELPASPERNEALAVILGHSGTNTWMQAAAFSSLSEGAGDMFSRLLAKVGTPPNALIIKTLRPMARMIGGSRRGDWIAGALAGVNRLHKTELPHAMVIRELAEGMNRAGEPLRRELAKSHKSAEAVLDKIVTRGRYDLRKMAEGRFRHEPAVRAEAVRTLVLSTFAQERERLTKLLDNRQPREVQSAVVETLGRFTDPQVGPVLLRAWPGMSPALRTQAIEVLFARPDRLSALLDAIEQKKFSPGELEPARIAMLRKHRDSTIRARAAKLLAEVKLRRRQEVIDAYSPALKLNGDIARGKAAFKKTCAKCHRVEGVGVELAPNLPAMKNRGAEAILVNVLDPNREVNPQYVNYLVQTEDGRTLTGMISAETATSVTLRRAEDQKDTVLRKDIAILQSTGLSIMPEGLEKEIDKQAMADLIAYLLSAK